MVKGFVRACQEAGIPYNPDFNGPEQEGCGFYRVSQRNGRWSSAVEYLRQARGRPNLTVQTPCFATKIRIENGRAVGVEYWRSNSKQTAFAPTERETLIGRGAIDSPKLLMLPGLGPGDKLKRNGIGIVQELAGAGRNLQEHFDVNMFCELNGPYRPDKYKKLHWKLWTGLECKLFKKGPVTSNVVEAGGFWYDDRSPATPGLAIPLSSGVSGLRVIDASAMPLLTSSKTFAPTAMIAEKGADLIRAG